MEKRFDRWCSYHGVTIRMYTTTTKRSTVTTWAAVTSLCSEPPRKSFIIIREPSLHTVSLHIHAKTSQDHTTGQNHNSSSVLINCEPDETRVKKHWEHHRRSNNKKGTKAHPGIADTSYSSQDNSIRSLSSNHLLVVFSKLLLPLLPLPVLLFCFFK